MRHLSLLVLAGAIFLASGPASAQPGSAPPPPPGGYGYMPPPPPPPGRTGFTIGLGLGLGGMSDSTGPIECFDCDVSPATVGFDLHLGGMISPRFALLGEIWAQGATLDSTGANALVQSMIMIAGQYWVTPQFWLKGGIGFANLSLSYDDGYQADSTDIDSGGAIMGAAGYEIISSDTFALDLQLRLGAGSYEGIDEQISVGTLGLGLNWY